MNDEPYTTPEEDPFNVQPFLLQPRRRRSSLLNKWIEEQQTRPHDLDKSPDRCLPNPLHNTPFVRYLDISSDQNVALDDALTLHSYDLVEDDDIPLNTSYESEAPSSLPSARSPRTSRALHTPSSFRGFSLSFRSASPALSSLSESGSPRFSSRKSIFPRTSRHSTGTDSLGCRTQQHIRSSSLSTVNLTAGSPFSRDRVDTETSHKWRPSVLGHFHGSSTSQTSVVPSDTVYTPSRPSLSSGDTYTSATTASDCDLPLTPPRVRFMDSIRSLNRSRGKAFSTGSGIASSSLVSFEDRTIGTDLSSRRTLSLSNSDITSSSTGDDDVNTIRLMSRLATSNINCVEDDEPDASPPKVTKPPDPPRAQLVYSSGGALPRVSFASLSSRNKKKRKLIVSGVGLKDFRKFEGVKRWCESFGEVSQIMRMPNGDLQVHFRLTEVADTVCRLRARVYIAGVGSVQLSWCTVDKR